MLGSESGRSGSCDRGCTQRALLPGLLAPPPTAPGSHEGGLEGAGAVQEVGRAVGAVRRLGDPEALRQEPCLSRVPAVPPTPRGPSLRGVRSVEGATSPRALPHPAPVPHPLLASLVTLAAAGKTSGRRTATGGAASAPRTRDLASLLPARVLPGLRAGSPRKALHSQDPPLSSTQLRIAPWASLDPLKTPAGPDPADPPQARPEQKLLKT